MPRLVAGLLPAVLVLTCCMPSHRPKNMLPSTVVVKPARPEARRISIPSPAGCDKEECEAGYADLTQWPDACTLVSQAEVKTVFPQAVKFRVSTDDVHFKGSRPPFGEIGIAKNARCMLNFAFQGDYVDDAGVVLNYGASVFVEVERVGTRRKVKDDYDIDRKDSAREGQVSVQKNLGPPECYLMGQTWTCDDDRVLFSVSLDYAHLPSYEKATNRVTLEIAGQPPHAVDLTQKPDAFAMEHIGVELVRLVSSKTH
jgi:hypothetical protein